MNFYTHDIKSKETLDVDSNAHY